MLLARVRGGVGKGRLATALYRKLREDVKELDFHVMPPVAERLQPITIIENNLMYIIEISNMHTSNRTKTTE